MDNNTNLYNPNTGQKLNPGQTVFEQSTGNKIVQGSQFSLPKNLNTVGADQINDQRNIKTPDIQPATYNSDLAGAVNGAVVSARTQSAAEVANQQRLDDLAASSKDINNRFGQLIDVNTEIGAVGSSIDRTAENKARQTVDQYTSDIEQMQRESEKRIKSFREGFRGLASGAEAGALKMQREDLSAQADKALLLSAATRNYSTLNAIAEQQVINKTAELKAKSDNLKAYIEMNKADFDKKEKRLYDEEQKKVDAELIKQTENEDYIKSVKINMAQSGIVNSEVISALSKIDTTKSDAMDKILKIPGISNYTISPADKLDLEIKRLNKAKLQKEISGVGSSKLLSVAEATAAGVPYGTTEAQLIASGGLAPFDIKKTTDSLTNLTWLKNTADKAISLSKGAGRTGTHEFIGGLFGITEKKRLQGVADTIRTTMLTMNTDPIIKKFFGPQMSEADVRMMTAGGTTLSPDTQNRDDFKEEALRVKDMFIRAEEAVKKGMEEYNTSLYFDTTGSALQVTNSPFSGYNLK